MFVFNSKNDTKQDNAHKTKRYHATRPGGQWNKGGGALVGIHPNHFLAATLSLFRQGGGVDYAHHERKFQLNFYPFRRAWLSGYATVFCVRIYLLIMSGKPALPPKKVKQNFLHCWSTLQKLE